MPTVYVTAPRDSAERIATTLVDERLAACVNYLECRSVYRWDDETVSEEETVLLIKTNAERHEDLAARIEEIHPYDVPCIERFDADEIREPFADWIEQSVR